MNRRHRRRESAYQVRLEPEQLEQLQLELAAQLQPQKKLGPEFSEFAARYLAWSRDERQKPSTVISKDSLLRTHLTPLFQGRRLGELTEEDVSALKRKLAKKSNKTVTNCLTVLRKMLRLAHRWGELDQVITINSPRVDRPKFDFYDFEQFEKLLETARRLGPKYEVIVLLAADAGLRLGEMVALELGDLDFRGTGEVLVRRSEWRRHLSTPKSGRSRAVPMTKALRRALERLLSDRRESPVTITNPRLLTRPNGGVLSYQGLQKLMRRLKRRAGVQVKGLVHVLRHTFCSHLAMRGAASVAIKELAGHSSITTTERYMHLATGERSRTIGLLDDRQPIDPAAGTRESL